MKKAETSKNDEILIPIEKLQEGFDLCRKQMELLIESAEMLHQSKKYSISIALSVLAREESAKLQLIKNHIAISSSILKTEWDSITKGFVHEAKLKGPLQDSMNYIFLMGQDMYEEIQKWGLDQGYGSLPLNYEDFKKVNETSYKRLVSLNGIKKDCFYLDWRNSSWAVFFNRSKEQLEAVSIVELSGVKYLLYGFVEDNLRFRDRDQKLQKEFELVKEKINQAEAFLKTKQFKIKSMIAWSVYKQYFKS